MSFEPGAPSFEAPKAVQHLCRTEMIIRKIISFFTKKFGCETVAIVQELFRKARAAKESSETVIYFIRNES